MVILIIAAMIATVAVLAIGVAGFARGGAFDEKWGNKLMQARIAFQAAAIGLLLLAAALA